MTGRTLALTFETRNGSTRQDVTIDHCVIAGWTGRDKAALEKHIKELEELGVKRPASTPMAIPAPTSSTRPAAPAGSRC